MRYTYKDSLKEAQYIIEGQYNAMLAPQKYKYLLEESMCISWSFTIKMILEQEYLKAYKYNTEELRSQVRATLDKEFHELKLSMSVESDELYDIISIQNK